MGQRRALRACAVPLAIAAALAGCGGGTKGHTRSATLLLDFTPNAVHAGIFSAAARRFDRAAGVRLKIREPSSSTDSLKLLISGRTDFAVLDIHDLGLARERGRDIVGVLALVQRPLAAVLAQSYVRRPRALEGRRVGVTGLPSDHAVLSSVVRGDGGDPRRVKEVTIGFNAVPSLLARRVAAATAFWNAEGIALARKRPGLRTFRVDDFGAPSYPELVVCVTRRTLRTRRPLVRSVLSALVRGYRFTLAHPGASTADLIASAPGLDRSLMLAELAALRTAFKARQGRFGELDLARLRAWAAWDRKFGILPQALDVRRAFDFAVAAG